MNIIYIKAAVLENTGIDVPLKDLQKILLDEGMITAAQAKRSGFSYSEYYGPVAETVIEEPQELDFEPEEEVDEIGPDVSEGCEENFEDLP